MENTCSPLVKFIRSGIREPSGVFPMNTEDVISRFFRVCANSQFVYIIKRILQGGLKIRIFIFC